MLECIRQQQENSPRITKQMLEDMNETRKEQGAEVYPESRIGDVILYGIIRSESSMHVISFFEDEIPLLEKQYLFKEPLSDGVCVDLFPREVVPHEVENV